MPDPEEQSTDNPITPRPEEWPYKLLSPGEMREPFIALQPGEQPYRPEPVRSYPAYGMDEPEEIAADGRRSCLASCLFIGVTIIVIVSLLGTSFLAFFSVRRQASQPQAQLQQTLSEGELAQELSLRDSKAPLSESTAPPLPTAAPQTAAADELANEAPLLNRLVLVDDQGQLATVSPDGSGLRQLTDTSDGTVFQFPAWSPDGQSVAAIGTNRGGGGIFVYDVANTVPALSEAVRYFSESRLPIYLYWSPDSENVAFLANHARQTFGLNIVPRNGATESQVLATGSPLYWEWAEDSEILLIHSGESGTAARLVAIDSTGTEQTPNLARPGLFQAPGISPGGRYWSYAEEEGRGVSTLIVAHTETGERRLVEQAGSLAMTWSPGSEQLAYTTGRVNAHPYWGPLRVVDAASGDTRLLTTETVLAFFWSPDGQNIAYITVNDGRRDDVYASADSRPQRVSRLAQPVQQGGSGFLSLSVVNVATGQGLRLLNFQPTAIFATQFMPFFAQYALSHRLWSPDGSAIVLPVRGDQGNVVMVVPVNGGPPKVVAEGDIAFWSHR